PDGFRAQRLELASIFRLRLDAYINLGDLRRFWSEVDSLERGILFDIPWLAGEGDRGPREIAALYSCLRCYLTLAARKNEEKIGAKQTDTEKQESSVKTPEKGMLSALVGAGSGTAVGAALLSGHPWAVVAATAASVGSVLLFNYSLTRSRERTETTEW